MFILYADKSGTSVPVGFQGYQDDVAATVDAITHLSIDLTPGVNPQPHSPAFAMSGGIDVTFATKFAMGEANKVADVFANLGSGRFELFADNELKNSIGIVMILEAQTIGFTFADYSFYNTKWFSAYTWNDESVLVTPYAQSSNQTTIDEFLSNFLDCSRICAEESYSLPYSRLRHPFQCVQKNAASGSSSEFRIRFLKSPFEINSKPLLSWLNYASLYTVMKNKPLFQADMMTVAGERFRPAVLYTLDMIESHGKVVYDKIKLHTIADNAAGITAGLNDVTISADIKGVKTDVPAKRFATDFMQLPSRTFNLYEMITAGVDVENATANPKNVLPRLIMANSETKDGILSIPFDTVVNGGDALTRTIIFAQTVPFTNLSASAKSAGDIDFSTIRIETDNPEEELYIPYITALIGAANKDVNKAITNINYSELSVATYPVKSTITGNDVLKFFYADKAEDWTPPDPVKPDIPQDNGNGGFNDNPDGGGNGTWTDQDMDTSVGDDPTRDPIYTMPTDIGISGNYEIVKLTNEGMRSLAEQSWTPDGWIANCMKLQGITRIGDGILSVKTCYAEIPSTGDANVVAVAGQALPKAIPCTRVQQYNQWKFDPIPIPRYFGSFLDYAPYTQIVVELPFGQPATIPPELVVGKSLEIVLRCDIMSETAMYLISAGKHLIAQVPADIFIHIPFGSSEYTQSGQMGMVNMMGQLGKVGMNIATGGLSSAVSNMKANPGDAYGGGITPQSLVGAEGASAAGQLASAATGMMNQTHQMQDSRNITQIDNGGGPGAIGAMGTKKPIVKISRPYVPIPNRFYELNGCPSGYIRKVGECKGYLEVSAIYGAIKCNTEEFAMITKALADGVFP